MSSFAAEPSSAAFVATPPPRSPQRKSPPRPRSTSTSTTASPSPSPCPSSTARRPQPPSRRRIHVPRLDLLPHKAHAPFPALRALVRQLQHPRHQHAPPPPARHRSRSPTASASTGHRPQPPRPGSPLREPARPPPRGRHRILGPNVRAAGFIHLVSSVSSLNGSSATPSPASLPDWQEILGPSNYMSIRAAHAHGPAVLPADRFVPPSAVQKPSMWECQKSPHGHKPSPNSPAPLSLAAAEELFIQCRCLRAPQINRGFADRRLWYLSKVRVKLIPSIAGKHEGWPEVILPNHLSPMNLKALRDLGLNAAKRKEITLQFQVSSIGSYSTQWMNRFHCLARVFSVQPEGARLEEDDLQEHPDPGLTPVGPRNAARDRVQLTRGPTSGAPNLQKEEDSPKPPEHWEVFSVFGDESPTLKGAMLSDQLPDATKPPPGCEKQ
ncbi:uncharacterized protein B0H18DRAFT_1119534 [Fomitopsis serialis]|uniref:uncharacterized protein n=1 Tax=Fomitopsis serialis TaxID=139415 RepID=UPI002008C6AC|nr:uncharacterized protein B0H18DRAFT_1119534 [Neoantrodia serialis]KAH9925088.1 hypothetical protein B0H18DRAFT_1119534 [Neoantrodia serialis]